MDETPPQVLISYTHDSSEHKERVFYLAQRLRCEGIDCNLDQYEDSPAPRLAEVDGR
ncbi:MAG: SEFIR domain-containing protein [Pyrinomonadaceae bacterium]